MKKSAFLWLILIVLLSVACTASEATDTPADVVTEATLSPAAEVVSPRVEEAPPTLLLEPTATTLPATFTPSPTEVTVTAEATNTAMPIATATTEVAVTTTMVSGRTEEGAFFLGNPEAPVTMIEYSDFL